MEDGVFKVTSYADLLALLHRDEVLHQSDTSDQSVRIPTQKRELDGVLILRWQESDGVIQFIQSVIESIDEEKYPVIESALARLNHALAIPGFDLNHEHGILCYRIYLPFVPRGFVLAEEIQTMFRLAVRNGAMFLPTLRRVLSGETTALNILEDAQRELASSDTVASMAVN